MSDLALGVWITSIPDGPPLQHCDIHPDRIAVAWVAARCVNTLGDPCLACTECVQAARSRC